MSGYILKDRKVIRVTMDEWSTWMSENQTDRSVNIDVAKTNLGTCNISTVFMGLEYGTVNGEPVVFETMIFGGEHNEKTWRCSTYEAAVRQHMAAIAFVLLPDLRVSFEGL